MKIEKLSENQIKFILNESDLIERNIKISELAYGSEKTQLLFREMLEQALFECGFEVNNVPLMIEAIPIATDSIIIIITKVNNHKQVEEKFNLNSIAKSTNKYKANAFIKPEIKEKTTNNISIFSFDTLDEVYNVCTRLKDNFSGVDILFKHNNKYYLYLEVNSLNESNNTDYIDLILSEYGHKHISNEILKSYLNEHGEVIVKNNAINIFCNYL